MARIRLWSSIASISSFWPSLRGLMFLTYFLSRSPLYSVSGSQPSLNPSLNNGCTFTASLSFCMYFADLVFLPIGCLLYKKVDGGGGKQKTSRGGGSIKRHCVVFHGCGVFRSTAAGPENFCFIKQ